MVGTILQYSYESSISTIKVVYINLFAIIRLPALI